MDRIAPSARIEEQIDAILIKGISDAEQLAQVGRLGAQLILQRAVEDEATTFLHRARYERSAIATGSRNGVRPKRVQTAEGQLTISVPQVRGTVEPFVSRILPHVRAVVRTRPLEALIIGAYVRGLSDRDIESLMDEAGLGHVSKSKASEICKELRSRYKAFCAKSLAGVEVVALLLDAIYLPTRPTVKRKACWSPGATRWRASVCCCPYGWASVNPTWTGWTWDVTSPNGVSLRRSWSSAMAHRG